MKRKQRSDYQENKTCPSISHLSPQKSVKHDLSAKVPRFIFYKLFFIGYVEAFEFEVWLFAIILWKVNDKRHRIVYDCMINDFLCHDRLIVMTVLMVMIGSNRGKSIITDFGCVRIILRWLFNCNGSLIVMIFLCR